MKKGKIVNKKDIIIYLILVLIVSIMCYPYLTMHYSTDDYTIIGDGYNKYGIETFLNAGRIFSSGITLLAGSLDLPINIFVQSLFYIGILISCLCVMEIRKCIIKIKPESNIKETILIIAISFCTIFNFMYLENMYFVEIPIMAMGILLFIKSSENLVDEKYSKSLIYLLFGELCYQGTINFFITFTFILLIIKYRKINKQLISKMIVAVFFCLIVVIINIIQIKICGKIFDLKQDRLGSLKSIPNNIVYIITHLYVIIVNSSDLFPKYIFVSFLVVTYIIIFIDDLKNVKEYSNSFNVLMLFIVATVSSVAINVISLSSFGLGRMVFSVGALIGLIFMYVYCCTNIFNDASILKNILICDLIIYTALNFVNYTNSMFNNKLANELDKQEALKINEYILEYEKNSNQNIEKIAICRDKNVTWNYNELKNKSLYTHRALMIWWCNVYTINYYTNRNLQEVPMNNEIYYTYFDGKDWNKLDREQFVFKDDTMYYCIY